MIGVFEIFKISVGPSSSHTMGPWIAALKVRNFLRSNAQKELSDIRRPLHSLEKLSGIKVRLCGSLAKTGAGHYTPMGVLMGLVGETPENIDVTKLDDIAAKVKQDKTLEIDEEKISFNPLNDILFDYQMKCDIHPNTLVFELQYSGVAEGKDAEEEIEFYSIGGGFIKNKGPELAAARNVVEFSKAKDFTEENLENRDAETLPYPYTSAVGLLKHVTSSGKTASSIILENEKAMRSLTEIDGYINAVYDTMLQSIFVGCHASGVLPGGLNVMRRAPEMARTLYRGSSYTTKEEWMKNIRASSVNNFDEISRWVICAALAVNEQNATCGRIVTAPTNGAAGVIPAVMFYFFTFDPAAEINFLEKRRDFFLMASMVGYLFKKNASISAAAAGCQGEIGVSSSMAAAALAYVKGTGVERAMMASEIAMEHHLGLTCDPIKGLVQVPCIERNTMGAMKAITACNLANSSDPTKAVVNLDDVIKTMWQTAKDMNGKYKETSEGGLAVNVSINYSEC